MKMTLYRWIWVIAVAVLLYFHLSVGTLVAIATAFYWLLEKQHRESLEHHRPSQVTPERLWCARGNHYIGNEPYTFIYSRARTANRSWISARRGKKPANTRGARIASSMIYVERWPSL